METYFFAKEVPATPIFLSNGRKLIFDTTDGITGYTITADPGLAGQLSQLIQSGVGGLRAASQEEYEDFIKKKQISEPKKQWREEITPQEILRANGPSPSVVGADRQSVQSQSAVNSPPPASAPFRPRTGSRKSKAE